MPFLIIKIAGWIAGLFGASPLTAARTALAGLGTRWVEIAIGAAAVATVGLGLHFAVSRASEARDAHWLRQINANNATAHAQLAAANLAAGQAAARERAGYEQRLQASATQAADLERVLAAQQAAAVAREHALSRKRRVAQARCPAPVAYSKAVAVELDK